MATDVKQSKYDATINAQLEKAESRIRWVDLSTAGLIFLAATLLFAVAIMLLDRRLLLAPVIRQTGLFVYLVAAGIFVTRYVILPLRWKVNPHYAARQLEATLGEAEGRNHLVNWIDLRDEKVAPVLKNVLGQRAVRDLGNADLERAISARRLLYAGLTAGVLAALFVTLFLSWGPAPFRSLLARAFVPFGKNDGIATRTQVSIIRPEQGDAVVTTGNPLTIVALVEGRIPDTNAKDAPRLLFRRNADEPYIERFLQADDSRREWSAILDAVDIGEGLLYKVAAGDAVTPEYRITVRASPLISDFQVTYRHRDYLKLADRLDTQRSLKGIRGTTAEIVIKTNRIVSGGTIEFESKTGKQSIRGERLPDTTSLRYRLVLDQKGTYRLRFQTYEAETYLDSQSYDVEVTDDDAPVVKITSPAKDVELPANGVLSLEGEASDDHGLARVTLRLQVVDGPPLLSKPFMVNRLGKPGFGYPKRLDYRDFIDLAKLKTADGEAMTLKPGDEVQYWLEAIDACDFPKANVSESTPRYKVKIAEPSKDKTKQDQARQDAEKKQKENEAQQEKEAKKQEDQRQEQKRQDEAKNREKEKERKEKKEGKGNKGDKGQKGEQKKPEDKKGDKNGEKKSDPQGEAKKEQDKKDNETRKAADKLKDQLDKKNKPEDNKGEDRKEKDKGEGKGAGENKPGKDKDKGEQKQEQGKGKDKGDGKTPPGEQKEQGKGQGQNAEGKGGQDKGNPQDKGQSKESGKPQEKPGQGKEQGNQKPGQGKGGKPKSERKVGEAKPEGNAKPQEQAEGKEQSPDGKPAEQPPGQAKAKGQEKQGEGKKGGQDASKKKPGEGKEGKPMNKPGQGKPGQGDQKPGQSKAESSKGDKPSDKSAENATRKEVDDLAKKMHEDNGKESRDAARKLNDIKNNAKDQQARDAARKELEKAAQNQAPAKGKEPGAKGGQKPGEEKKDEGKGKQPPGEAKPNPDGKPGSEGKGKEAGQGMPPKDDPMGKPMPPGKSKGPGRRTATGKPGDDNATNTPAEGNDKDPTGKGEKPSAHRASQLQLEEFEKKIDDKILKDAKMSRKQFEQFLKDYAELARRQPNPPTPERLPDPSTKGTLPSVGGRTIKGDGTMDNPGGGGRAKPPPGYRDSYADFLRRLNKK